MCENGRRKKIGGKKNTNTKKTQCSWKQGNNTWCGYWLRFYLEHKKIPGKIIFQNIFQHMFISLEKLFSEQKVNFMLSKKRPNGNRLQQIMVFFNTNKAMNIPHYLFPSPNLLLAIILDFFVKYLFQKVLQNLVVSFSAGKVL